ncbi:hypothetical protein [Pararhodobacter oceanensis]|uniref:DUF4177 domain-containing protein n=1 Tax=Pararhodobacter oceanensis TaxID=2172121 RepID=A0A2T8HSK6_9RHOB|nr:hypothetical protein [Pararhodobacter oceanensis]PVH28431.1 hypothetical protein DDE20_12730 [Pararhodobacter oceanensis]
MKFRPFLLTLGASLMLALPASAQCYAEYRAQQIGAVIFHTGVATISDAACGNNAAAYNELVGRLQRNGWTLANVSSTFREDGLASRRSRAGQYYLRY